MQTGEAILPPAFAVVHCIYNALQESMVPVSWSTLLVISNVPNTPSGSSEVQKLVRRFGTVIKTLVLNNTVICEMATAAMALSVYKRFQTFPCIIHNNPLFFSRKPDPKCDTLTKVITAYLSSSEDAPKNGKSSQMAAAAEEGEVTPKKKSALEGMENTFGTEKKMKYTVEMDSEDKALGENRSKDKIKKEGRPGAAPNTKPEAALDTETSTVQTVVQTTEEDTGVDKTRSGEKTKQSSTDAASRETFMPELPKVTQQMVNALLEECRTQTTSHINSSNNTASSSCGVKGESQGESLFSYKAAEDMKELTKSHTEEMKKQEREVRKEKDPKARGRKDRERGTWDKEERAKRVWEERARRERGKREEQRREWDRKERKRAYREGLSGSRTSCRSEGFKQSWRCGQSNNNKAVEEGVAFPFNMTDFVTVDEVGDVTNLPCSPSPGVVMETTEGKKDAVTSDPQVTCGATPMEVATATTTSDAAVTPEKSEVLECELVSAVVTQSSNSLLILKAAAACVPPSQTDSPPSQTHEPSYQEEAAEKPPKSIEESTSEIEQLSLAAWVGSPPEDATVEYLSNSQATGHVTAESLRDKTEDSNLNQIQAKVWTNPSKTEQKEEKQDQEVKQPEVPGTDTGYKFMSLPGKQERLFEAETELSVKKLQNKTPMSTDYALPPFDPSKPIGMEFLVPKTGFFCKVCNRFFSGTKEVEMNHCKTVKHYKNLQKYLQTTKAVNDTAKPS